MRNELVANWMSPDVITVTPDTSLTDADNLLHEYNIRRLPVIDEENNLLGIVTLGDIREASASDATSLSIWELNYLLEKLLVQKIMTPNPITVYSNDSIAMAASLMLENKISGLPVLDPADESLVGIITESDIFSMVVQDWEEFDSRELEPA
ncbi:MAG: CBS domain-containing protein [Anaerolineae bacterium]|nr:CBS domain-containing protein [Anaerolineae bacterium]MCB9098780.1 CBS domain-containing protein [Anaerolineales bacterium]